MPRPGIHYVLRDVTVVLRNGASVQMKTTVQREAPYRLKVVRWEATHGLQAETLLAAQIYSVRSFMSHTCAVCTLFTQVLAITTVEELSHVWDYTKLSSGLLRRKRHVHFPAMTDSYLCQDPTNHPAWTGEEAKISADSQAARFMKRFGSYQNLPEEK